MRKSKLMEMPENPSDAVRDYVERYNARILKRQAEKEAYRKEKAEASLKIMESIHVGDIFEVSWGYEQTNVDFFQVIKITGKNSVKIRQVEPSMISDCPSGPMAADRTYEIPQNGELLPPSRHSVFIRDQVNGDTKRVQAATWYADHRAYIRLSSFATAYKVKTQTITTYESWYA